MFDAARYICTNNWLDSSAADQQVKFHCCLAPASPKIVKSAVTPGVSFFQDSNPEYVNFPPGSSISRPMALSPVEKLPSNKGPIPTPRSVSVDPSRRGGGGGGLAAPDPHQQSLSMPPIPVKGEEDEEDISHGLEDDIHSRALEVVETGREFRLL